MTTATLPNGFTLTRFRQSHTLNGKPVMLVGSSRYNPGHPKWDCVIANGVYADGSRFTCHKAELVKAEG